MNAIKLVCPNDRALIDRLEKRTLCVRVDAGEDIVAAANNARARNDLFCVIWDSKIPLDETEVRSDWRNIPIALMAPAAGRFCNLRKKLKLFRKLNLRVYLPCDGRNLTDARLLASVGIPTCVVFDTGKTPDWDALADLMTYALLGIAPHAPMEPFQTIANCYRQTSRSEDWGRAYFDDPAHYLHVDQAGRIALSRRELLAGKFVAGDVSELDSPEVEEAIDERTEAWRDLFLGNHFCARCKAWRICGGKFSEGKSEPDGCAEFFDEMADVVEQYRKGLHRERTAEKWQP